MYQLEDLKWRKDEVDAEEVRRILQMFQFSKSTTDDGCKIVPQVLIAASRYAIEDLQSEIKVLSDELNLLRLQSANSHLKVGAPIRYTTGSAIENKFYSGDLTDQKYKEITGRDRPTTNKDPDALLCDQK